MLPSSCHPATVTDNIPYSLALRIVRICSEESARDQRLSELKEMLLQRDYKAKSIDSCIAKAKAIPRCEAIKRVVKCKVSDRPVFVVRYDPRLPHIPSIVKKHWRSMTLNPDMKIVFKKPPLVAFKRPHSIGDKLIRAKLPPAHDRPKRYLKGMKKCGKARCLTCPFVMEVKHVHSTSNNYSVMIDQEVNCQTCNVIYCITCIKCLAQYIGETQDSLNGRFLDHRGYVMRKELDKVTGAHFNQKGHSVADMRICVVEKIRNPDPNYRKERESMYIQNFGATRSLINKKR